MVPEAIDLVGGLNIALSVALLVAAVILLLAAYAQKAPWSMVAGAVAIVLLGCAGLVSALARYEWFDGAAPLMLLVLRWSAFILLSGGAWTLTARWWRRRRMP